MRRHVAHPALRLALRLLAALPGAYAFSAALVASAGAVLHRLGLARSDAVVLAAMLGFVSYLLLVLWVFAQRSLWRIGLVFAAGFGACAASLWLLGA